MNNIKSKFIKGAFILVIANIIVKIIGAVFKIPLANLIEEDGMGLFTSAFSIYAFMFTFATAGFPIAISKMVAESEAKGNSKQSQRILLVSVVILGILGLLGSGALFFFAEPIAEYLKNSRAYVGIQAISPGVFFVALSCAFRGYFQGKSNMLPTAISNVFEALGKLIVGYVLALLLLNKGTENAAAGAAFGVVAGAFLSLVYLVISFIFQKKPKQSGKTDAFSTVLRNLLIIAIPITLGACIQSITTVIDTFTIVRRLQEIPGITQEIANSIFGGYTGFVMPIFLLPLAITTALAMPIVPSIISALAIGNKKQAERITALVLKITVLFAMPCFGGCLVLGKPIIETVFKNPPSDAGFLLSVISVSILFSSLLAITNSVLQAYNKIYLPVIFMTIGGILKLLINLIFIPKIGIIAVPIATNILYAVVVVLNLIAIIRTAKIKLSFVELGIKPLISTGIMGIVAYTANSILSNSINNKLACLVSIAIAGIVYIIALFATKLVGKEELVIIRK